MTAATASNLEGDRPKAGDRVKIIGSHRYAGFAGVYLADRAYYEGGDLLPVVKLDRGGETIETFVHDAERQLRKI